MNDYQRQQQKLFIPIPIPIPKGVELSMKKFPCQNSQHPLKNQKDKTLLGQSSISDRQSSTFSHPN